MNRITLLPAARLQAIAEAAILAEFNPNKARDLIDWFGDDISAEARAALRLRGRVLGAATMRTAYAHKEDPQLCIKVAATELHGRGNTHANKGEAANWHAISKFPELAKWFAPVRWISECGFVLFQDRAKVFKDGVPRARFPAKMPGIFNWLNDMHSENFGFIGKQIVVLDYPDDSVKHALAHPEARAMFDVGWNSPISKFPTFTNTAASGSNSRL